MRGIDENFINRVDVDILRCHILQVNIVDLGAGLHILCHLGRSDHIVNSQLGMSIQLCVIAGSADEGVAGSLLQPLDIGLLDLLDNLKESCPTGYAVLLQSRRNSKAYGFLRAAQIRHNKVSGHGVKTALHTFHRCVK